MVRLLVLRCCALLLLLACTCTHPALPEAAPQPPTSNSTKNTKNILFLYSYGYGSKGVEIFSDGFRSKVTNAGISINQLFFEYLDLERNHSDPRYRERLLDFLQSKYAARPIDLVITAQQPALGFLLNEGRTLAPDAPVITVQAPMPGAAAIGQRRLISQLANFDAKGTLEHALRLFPATRRIVLVAGSSAADRKMEADALATAAPWKDKLALETTSGLALEAMLQRLATLPPHSIVLFLQYNRDINGQITVAHEVERRMVKVANAPVFGLYDFNLQNGGVGGSVISVRQLGENTGQLALDFLHGTRSLSQWPQSMHNEAVAMFDWDKLASWGADPRLLPDHTLFVNRTPAFWEQSPYYLMGLFLFIMAQTALILGLGWSLRRHRLAERLLRESNATLRYILEVALDGFWQLDERGNLMDVNPSYCLLSGYAREELLCMHVSELEVLGNPDEIAARVQKLLATGAAQFESVHRRKDGSFWQVETSVICRSVGTARFFAFLRDITERKRVEQALRASEDRMRGIFENVPVGIFAATHAGKFVYANPALGQILGYDSAQDLVETVNRTSIAEAMYVDPTRRDTVLEGLANDKRWQTVENRYRRKDGRIIDAVLTMGERQDATTGESLLHGIITDISERKRGEHAIMKLNADLEQRVIERTLELGVAKDAAEAANRAKSAFLANMSHELRTPMNAILGFAQLLQHDDSLGEDSRKKVATINRAGQHLLALINDVLEISRIESGRSSVRIAAFNLNDMLHELEDLMRLRVEDKWLAFAVQRCDPLPSWVLGDVHHLKQILINLIANGAKYTEQGHIKLHVRSDGTEDGHIVFAVEDTGPGIAESDQERIFQAFYQTELGMLKGDGTGLGLSISRQYARLMDGELSVASQVGQGCVFTLRVPLPGTDAPESAAGSMQRTPIIALELGAQDTVPRLLVVDDKPDNRELVYEMLTRVGFLVQAVENGLQALAAFTAWQPQLILMDMRMPVMDGYEATQKIRAMPSGKDVRIVALTANAFEEDRAAILAAGCDEMLKKPVLENDLYRLLGALLGIGYRYGTLEPNSSEQAAADASSADLSALPTPLLDELQRAAECLDVEAVRAIAARIAQEHAQTSRSLDALVQNFRFDRIVELCATASTQQE